MDSIRSDYHMHSAFSADSSAPMEAQIRAAIAQHLESICFTEHVDLDWPYDNTPTDGSDSTPFRIDYPAYRAEYLRLKEQYRDRISIYFGLEMGLDTAFAKEILDYPGIRGEDSPYDFVLGSTHSSQHKDPYYPTFFEGRTVPEALHRYFQDALDNVRTFSFYDSYAHLDYVLRYAIRQYSGEQLTTLLAEASRNSSVWSPSLDRPYTFSDWAYEENQTSIDEILRILISRHTALECNTQALRRAYPDTNPGYAVLQRYHDLGGRLITIGADAHSPESVGYGREAAAQRLRACGFDSYVTYEHRIPVIHKL